jgi:hypothetical protein
MGTDANEVVVGTPSSRAFKVHGVMCAELKRLVDKIEKIFPEIEAARPRCSSGLQTLCLLSNTKEKAKSLLQYCTESSKLYLVLTGDSILTKCKNMTNLFAKTLSQIQNMVPVLLAAEISRIVSDLQVANFILDPVEDEAGKAVKMLFKQTSLSPDSIHESATKSIQFAARRLGLTSPKNLLIEKRSIKKLVSKSGDNEQKKQRLVYLFGALKRYEKSISRTQTENNEDNEHSFSPTSGQTDSSIRTSGSNTLMRPTPPEEYKCPLSARLMYDPVIIDSGQTFERMWIRMYLDEGHDTCPVTKCQLKNLSLMPNKVIKDLITKWCTLYGVAVSDPYTDGAHSWENCSASVSSFTGSMNDLYLPVDLSNVSLNFSDSSLTRRDSDSDSDSLLKKLDDGLSWESKCDVVEDFVSVLKQDEKYYYRKMTSENFFEPLFRFLSDAADLIDVDAQRTGCRLLLGFLKQCRGNIPNIQDESYVVLTSFLDSKVKEEALEIMEIFSGFRRCRSKIAESGALNHMKNIIETKRRDLQETIIKILRNLSSESEICFFIASSEFVPKLAPFIEDKDFSSYIIYILSKSCEQKAARISIVETEGCLASIVRILESDNCEDQEHAVSILLTLCSNSDEHCQMIQNDHKSVVPALVFILLNGNDSAKRSAEELLKIIDDTKHDDDDVAEFPSPDNNHDIQIKNADCPCLEKNSVPKARGFFRKMISPKSSSLKKK